MENLNRVFSAANRMCRLRTKFAYDIETETQMTVRRNFGLLKSTIAKNLQLSSPYRKISVIIIKGASNVGVIT